MQQQPVCWFDGTPISGGIEKIALGQHVPFDYLVGETLYDAAIDQPRQEFEIRSLIHATNSAGCSGILKDKRFEPGRIPKQLSSDLSVPLLWLGTSPDLSQCQRPEPIEVLNSSGRTRKQTYWDSPPFNQTGSRYGNFVFELAELLLEENLFPRLPYEKPEYRVLGTFLYKQEVMYSVLVCPEQQKSDPFHSLPLLGEGTEVIRREGDKWFWKPFSTGKGSDCYAHHLRMWDHLTFAIYLPDPLDAADMQLEDRVTAVDNTTLSGKIKGDGWGINWAGKVLDSIKQRVLSVSPSSDPQHPKEKEGTERPVKRIKRND